MKVPTVVYPLTLASLFSSPASGSYYDWSSAASSVETFSSKGPHAVKSDPADLGSQQPMGSFDQSNSVAPHAMVPEHLIEFIDLPNQEEAKKAIESQRGWFHNLLQYDSEGTWVCYAVPDGGPRKKGGSYMYRIICAWSPMIFQGEEHPDRNRNRKPYSGIEQLHGQLKTLEELKSFFEGKMYWRWQATAEEL